MAAPNPSAPVLKALGLESASLEQIPSGLINTTWIATLPDGAARVLQRVNPLWPREINDDVNAVTQYLAALDIVTPVLVPAVDGNRIVEDEDGIVWRQMTHIPGVTYDALANTKQAQQAGALLGRFHRLVSDIDHEFSEARLGVHDTPQHLKNLLGALLDNKKHARFRIIDPLATQILELASDITSVGEQPNRVVHGDPKISNVIFEPETDVAICLIDFDTMRRTPVALELGDAFRSWCNPKPEDEQGAEFSLPLFEAGIEGYARETRDFLTEAEWQDIPGATYTITVELAARFCADALNENYFGWDEARFASASEHNEARTRGQIDLARSIASHRAEMDRIVAQAFGPG